MAELPIEKIARKLSPPRTPKPEPRLWRYAAAVMFSGNLALLFAVVPGR